MTTTYGLRENETGRLARLASSTDADGSTVHLLTTDYGHPVWSADNLADLILTYCETRAKEASTPTRPSWDDLDQQDLQPVRFVSEAEYDVDGGDPVSITHRIKPFAFNRIIDMRGEDCRGGDPKTIHYGIMQGFFLHYDMDDIEHLSLGILPFKGEVPALHGDIALTADIGPACVVEVAMLPDDWSLGEKQAEAVARLNEEGWQFALVLCDSRKIVDWIDYDSFGTDNRLTCRHSTAHGFAEDKLRTFRP